MADINIQQDLVQVTSQIEAMVGQLTKLNTERESLTQQIHNLNGIAMYLRGKQQEDSSEIVPEITHEVPPEIEDN